MVEVNSHKINDWMLSLNKPHGKYYMTYTL